jgi:putative transposase
VVRNYKFRLYPTALQEQQLVETLDGCRWVYNYFLGKNISKEDMQFALTELKEEEPFLRNYHSKMLQMVVHRIDSANKALGALGKNGHKVGKLHYLTDEKYNSFTYNQSGFKIENNRLWLSKIGHIKIRLHRQPFNIKQVTIKRDNRKWYAIVACEFTKPIFKFINPRKSVGIDVGITKFAHDSDNYSVDDPLFLTKMIKPLRRAHREMSRRKKGSNNYNKTKHMLAKLYERIRNRRKDFLHKLSTEYTRRYDIIFLERLRTLNMVKNHHIARYILDSSWYGFKCMLDYKAKLVVEVELAYTSIDCSRCGNKVPKSLAVRIHSCDKCRLAIDRDYNASLNIKQKGLQIILPVERREVTPVEILCESKKQEMQSTKIGSSSHYQNLG